MVSLDVFYDYGNVTNAWRDIDPVSGYGAACSCVRRSGR